MQGFARLFACLLLVQETVAAASAGENKETCSPSSFLLQKLKVGGTRKSANHLNVAGNVNFTQVRRECEGIMYLVLDSSSSICGTDPNCPDWDAAKKAGKDVIDGFAAQGGTKVSVLLFSNQINWVAKGAAPEQASQDLLGQAHMCPTAQNGGCTHTEKAFDAISGELGNAANQKNFVVLITDGKANNLPQASAAAQQLRNVAEILGIGVGRELPKFKGQLEGFTGKPGNVYGVNNYQGISDKVSTVIQTGCSATPPGKPGAGICSAYTHEYGHKTGLPLDKDTEGICKGSWWNMFVYLIPSGGCFSLRGPTNCDNAEKKCMCQDGYCAFYRRFFPMRKFGHCVRMCCEPPKGWFGCSWDQKKNAAGDRCCPALADGNGPAFDNCD